MGKKKIDKPTPQEWAAFSEEAKFDWLMDAYLYGDEVDLVAMKHYGATMTINQARGHMERRILEMINKSSVKCKCPACHKTQGYQHHSLDDGIVEFGWVLMNLALEDLEKVDLKAFGVDLDYMLDNEFMPSFHFNDDNKNGDGRRGVISVIYNSTADENGANGRKPLGYSPLKHFGFMKGDYKHRNPLVLGRGKTNGFWYPLRTAYDYYFKGKAVISECWTFNDEVVKWGTQTTTFADCKIVDYKDRQKFRTTYYK